MAYDEQLAVRVRSALADTAGVAERRMFGGLCYLLRGNMCCGVVDDRLMVRVGPKAYASLLALPHVREMDFTGRPLTGMVYVGADGLRTARDLAAWIERGLAFARTLPRKPAAPARALSGGRAATPRRSMPGTKRPGRR
jgi:TfoX/Sxy family transcriptional regulator of competence genes